MLSEETGVQGQVLRGPVVPGPVTEGQADEEPFSASFHVLDGRKVETAQFRSDKEGRFRVVLAPGEYTIIPDASAPILFPTRQTKTVRAPAEGFAEVVLRFDTGIR